MAIKKNTPPIGPQTKREAKKSERQDKRAIRRTPSPMAAPKIKRTIETPESKAAKRKERMKSAAAIGGSIIGTIGTIAADARLGRGSQRIYDRDQNDGGYKVRPTTREKWNAGKNKKSTKK